MIRLMTALRQMPGLAPVVTLLGAGLLSMYFAFASIQGDYGLFQRMQIELEQARLRDVRDELAVEIAALRNKTRRLSDDFLDLELLDAQARDVLGLLRPDEIVLH